MPRPTAILAEDEPLLRAELKEALARLWPELEIVAECEDGAQALAALQAGMPQLLVLDIQMPGASGLEVARAASGRCHVVFVTAYAEHAVAAFEQGAVDYLLKPLSPARLATALARVRERLRGAPPRLDGLLHALEPQPGVVRAHLRWICVAQGRSMRLITCDEIAYFQADNKYTRVVTAGGEALISKTIRQLIDELDPAVFLQIHRGTLVNVNAVASVDRDLRGGLKVRLKRRPEVLPVSAPFVHLFRHM